MKQVTFYLLKTDKDTQIAGLNSIEALVCYLTEANWRKDKRILIVCKNKQQAIRLDKVLWQYHANAFVPHNLAGEGPKYGAPVELAWPQCNSTAPRDLMINLLPQFIDCVNTFHEVIDFVPYEEPLKQQARDRYKAYRNIGFHLKIARPPLQLKIT